MAKCQILTIADGMDLCITCRFLYVCPPLLNVSWPSIAKVPCSGKNLVKSSITALSLALRERRLGELTPIDGTLVDDAELMPSHCPQDFDMVTLDQLVAAYD